MDSTGLPPPILVALFAGSLLFAGWVAVSLGILLGMARHRLTQAGGPGYFADPVTRTRRRLWLGLTVVLSGVVLLGVGFLRGA